MPLFLLSGFLNLVAGQPPFTLALGIFWATRLPGAVAMLRSPPPTVTIGVDRCVIDHGGHFTAPVTVRRDDLHSIVPVWLRPAKRSPVRAGPTLPLIGDGTVGRADALVLVLREERTLRQARSSNGMWGAPSPRRPVRGFLLVVDDLGAAQRAFQPWGLLARLTPGAFEWLAPRSTATSPGPEPVYGT